MKQEIKKLAFLLLLMSIFTSSQEKTCVSSNKCSAAPVVMENNIENISAENSDCEIALMPIGQFILLQ